MTTTLSYHERALELHRRLLVIDGHADTLDRVLEEGHDFLEPAPDFHIDLPRLMEAGMNCQVFSLWTPPEYQGERATVRALAMISAFLDMQRERNELRQISRVSDLDPQRPGFCFSFEGAEPLAGNVSLLDAFYRLGVRMIALTWNGRNPFADGLKVGPNPSGLTELGYELIERMDELGVVLDLAHIAEPGFWDAMKASRGPVVATHANARALHDHPRNLKDEQLKAIAERGGLIGVTFVPSFLATGGADLDDVLAHIDYMVQLIGEDHVALGSDFDGITAPPTRLTGVQCLPALTEGMLRRGYSEERVAKILGTNWARVFGEIWK